MRAEFKKPRRVIWSALAFLLAGLAASGAQAGLIHPASWRKSSDDRQFVLVMVSPLPVDEDAGHQAYDGREIRDIRACYSVSGVYRGDSAVPLWTIPYWPPGTDAFISPDGNHVVMSDTDWRQSSGHIATFYRSGNEVASYNSLGLIPLIRLRATCGVYHPACTANVIDWKAMTLTVGTNQGDEFVFDVTSGKVLRQWSSFPLYLVWVTSLAATVLLAIVAWIVVRSRRSRVEQTNERVAEKKS